MRFVRFYKRLSWLLLEYLVYYNTYFLR